jgi:2-isopropylmalate synthase
MSKQNQYGNTRNDTVVFDHKKYRATPRIHLPNRRWPEQQITAAPQWCSVDLRDGNQALPKPMNPVQKRAMFEQLVAIGFKQIEVGFPAASQPDFDFVRELIEQNLIPDDVTVQVLTQAREEIIARTFEALRGVKRAVVHVYNSTSVAQRRYVFNSDRNGVRAIAVQGAMWVRHYAAQQPETAWIFQYSPESFTQTEIDFAVECCSAVCDVWRPDEGQPVIINLPSTVEVDTPNVFADRIEWFCNEFPYRRHVVVSVHTHNDRGCAVAAAELAVMAGADRVEGTLFGNGERTGNMDIVTMAMNLYSQGVDPQLDFSDMAAIVRCAETCTEIPVGVRHPYAGELVYTAFSGSHQDAIRKGLAAWQPGLAWDVPYLPIDPQDVGRAYEEVVRVNSQSGKGGVTFTLERESGFELPRDLQIAFSRVVQRRSEEIGGEVSGSEIAALFDQHYVNRAAPWQLQRYRLQGQESDSVTLQAELERADGGRIAVTGSGNGTLAAMVAAAASVTGDRPEIVDYHEHALGSGTAARAACYICLQLGNERQWGVGVAEDTVRAALLALISAINASAAVKAAAA